MAPQFALVLWQKENKCSVEPLNNVPENSRFPNAATPVMFSGDRKWYPASIVKISSDQDELEKKAQEVATEIAMKTAIVASKRVRIKKGKSVATATEAQVALALGGKKPIPENLESAKRAALRAKKNKETNQEQGNRMLDKAVLSKFKRTLFQSSDDTVNSEEEDAHLDINQNYETQDENVDDQERDHDKSEFDNVKDNDDAKDKTSENEMSVNNNNCSCSSCAFFKVYAGNSACLSFLQGMLSLLSEESEGPNVLQLKSLPDNVKKVELTCGKGVWISLADKNQLKLDYAAKPSALIRETLFTLYGKDPFKLENVTARGSRAGTIGISKDVLEAVAGFVNRNVNDNQRIKVTDLVNIINKRAPDWKKAVSGCPSLGRRSRAGNQSLLKSRKLYSLQKQTKNISPWKVTPLLDDTPSKEFSKSSQGDKQGPSQQPSAAHPQMGPAQQPTMGGQPQMGPAHQQSAVHPQMGQAQQPIMGGQPQMGPAHQQSAVHPQMGQAQQQMGAWGPSQLSNYPQPFYQQYQYEPPSKFVDPCFRYENQPNWGNSPFQSHTFSSPQKFNNADGVNRPPFNASQETNYTNL